MKHQLVITFEIPDGTPADDLNLIEQGVRDFLDENTAGLKFGTAWTSEAEPTFCQNLAPIPRTRALP